MGEGRTLSAAMKEHDAGSATRRMMPFGVDFDLIRGIMMNPDNRVVRQASSMRGHYKDAKALEALIAQGDPLHYEVFEMKVPLESGQVMFCLSKTYPGTVGGECFMTKGHYHEVPDTAEIYLCLHGAGYMLMKLADGQSAYEPLYPGRLCYVPPYWGHRTVNTCDEPLITFCAYPGNAGHNYRDIEKEGFPLRVFKSGGTVEIVRQ